MADNPLKRYLDAGIAFTALTQAKAEAIVKDLVSAGEVQAEQAQALAADLIDRSRQNTERLVEVVRKEVADQVTSLGLVGQAELARLEKRIESLTGVDPAAAVRKVAGKKEATETAVRKVAAKKAAATRKQTAAKKAPAKKTAAKRAPAKKTAAKKAPAKKTAVKKTAAKRAPAKKTAAKKAPAKKR